MIKHILYIILLISSTSLMAQNNAIFGGGNTDGHTKDCYQQLLPVTLDFSGGNGDGHSKDCYQQTLVQTVSFYGGVNDGYAKDCYKQQSNLNNIFSGGNGGDGMLNSCANEPLGCFLAISLGNDTTFCEGETLILDAGSFPGGVTYFWQDSSIAQTFLVDTTGTYYVTVTDTSGCIGIDSVNVVVNPVPVFNLGNDTAFCAGNTLVLNAQNSGATYQWQNGTTAPFFNQSFSVSATGQYFVNVSFGICSDSDTINVIVNPIITTNLTDSIICQGDSSLIFGIYQTTAGTYRDTINASTNCDSILVQQLIVNPTFNQTLSTATICNGDSALILGNYETVAATYSDTLQSVNGCDSIVSQTLNVNPSHLVSLGNDTAFCAGDSITLDAGSGAGSYRWQNGITAPFQMQTFIVNTTGTYNVVTTLGACTTTDTINITVNPNQTTNYPDSMVCQGDSSLIFGNYESIAGIFYDTLSTYLGCDSVLIQQLVVNPVYNNNLGTVTICAGDSALILGNYESVAGTYFDTLQTIITGCDSIVSQTLGVLSNLSVNLGNDTAICSGENIVLDAGAGTSYLWQDNSFGQTFIASTAGQYYVNVTTGTCSASDTINLTLSPYNSDTLPIVSICQGDSTLIFGIYQTDLGIYQDTIVASVGCDTIVYQQLVHNTIVGFNLGNDTIICQEHSFTLDAGTGGSTYSWNTGDTTQTITVDAATLAIGEQTYIVQVIDSGGCIFSDTIVVEVTVCTGINERNLAKFKLYPNPTKGETTIISNKLIKKVELYNVIGERVMNQEARDKKVKINIEHLNKGVYFVKVLYNQGSTLTKLILD